MKTLALASLSALSLSAFSGTAKANNADAILGTYLNPDKSRTVRVYKENGRYFGVIATAPAVPDGSEGVGYLVFDNFEFSPTEHQWTRGELRSPMYGRQVFSGVLSLNDTDDLIVHGFVGIPLLGASSVFPRVE